MFFFKGRTNASFAFISAGGRFCYVGSIHESFSHALELSKRGYNAFALHYHIVSVQYAVENLARAIAFVFKNKDIFEIDTQCYSLWGGSAGARMAVYLGYYGPIAFGGDHLSRSGDYHAIYWT